ncbi:VOC family protein [Brochothrix campestris]|uniref:Glyoxalase/bleomycin resistance protein/dioxygenase n=1 Tax=Brochothrix campestris FSL F6-1037 TaxID=1265861 RepID=W7D468_9LIST|nr:VOC family protein [Brochothrix campestris]EUJ40078.1 glyoxalase/bleomycin resistance protein/dioxygenase [Brochothrix campestris FSL F6-1037]
MDFKSDMILGTVALNISDLKASISYYTEIIGLTLLSQTEKSAELGLKDNRYPLVRLEQGVETESKTTHAGLYHLALLLPTRESLAQFIYNLIINKREIGGAGDHLYSEAFYFTDPDGNGIEIYADRPYETWDVHEDGLITTATNAVNVNDILKEIKTPLWEGMPAGTIMGHVHLQVSDIEYTKAFYHDLLSFSIKTIIPRALFMSRGLYHHQIGTNNWIGHTLPERPHTESGMLYYTMRFADVSKIVNLLQEKNYPVVTNKDGFFVADPNGIKIKLEQQ